MEMTEEMNAFSSGRGTTIQRGKSPALQTVRERDKFLKAEVNLHFENHLQKWWKRKRFPFKIVQHLLLVILVTVQVSDYNAS